MMELNRVRSAWNLKEEQVSTSMLEARLSRSSSKERLLATTPLAVVAMIPTDCRVPDEVPGSVYRDIADRTLSLAEGLATMDRSCVVHSRYADAWLRHVWCERKGYARSLVAWAEHHDLVREHIHPRDLEYDRIVDVLDDAVPATANI
jgi:hypothetical protein